jgi:hypothetical protein
MGPTYFDLFRTQQQVHEKISRQTAPIDAWGGILVGVRKPPVRVSIAKERWPPNRDVAKHTSRDYDLAALGLRVGINSQVGRKFFGPGPQVVITR